MSYMPRIENTKTLRAFELNVGTLRQFLDGIDDSAEISIDKSSPDRPGERTTYLVRVTSVEGDPS